MGQLAAATGVSMRTLRHDNEIALLRPSARAGGGPRRYRGPDVARLHHILALRGLGAVRAAVCPAQLEPSHGQRCAG